MSAAPVYSSSRVSGHEAWASDPVARLVRDAADVVSSGELAKALRHAVQESPGMSLGGAVMCGYILGAGLPPALVGWVARATGRALLATLLQNQLAPDTSVER